MTERMTDLEAASITERLTDLEAASMTELCDDYRLPSSFKYHQAKTRRLRFPDKIVTELSVRRSDPATTMRLEEPSRAPAYHLVEGDSCRCTVGKHRYPLSLQKANDCVLWRRIIDTTTLH